MSPALRKIGLTAHITLSIAWLGSVLSFLVLAVVGLTSGDADTVRSAYVAMNLIGRLVIVPLSLAALAVRYMDSPAAREAAPLIEYALANHDEHQLAGAYAAMAAQLVLGTPSAS